MHANVLHTHESPKDSTRDEYQEDREWLVRELARQRDADVQDPAAVVDPV